MSPIPLFERKKIVKPTHITDWATAIQWLKAEVTEKNPDDTTYNILMQTLHHSQQHYSAIFELDFDFQRTTWFYTRLREVCAKCDNPTETFRRASDVITEENLKYVWNEVPHQKRTFVKSF